MVRSKNDSYARRTAGVTPIRVSRTVEAAPTVERAAEDMLSTSARRAAEDVRPLRRCRPSTIRPLRRRGACTIRTIHRCGVSAFGMEVRARVFGGIRRALDRKTSVTTFLRADVDTVMFSLARCIVVELLV
ncbi:uncharacterized protein LOC105281976 isoform X2 [Ooceraea biroi]|uniref:uncharacterized protein LOC113561408 isoform X2 n=1 Tax=Ooceraea biroi TaxID=2015173 RepID=UPI0005BB16FD|nr:uncharacterized protein LOC113561408 isoform X2 [Ooceraea biroi]XP_026830429.1 uncharacterized protein LOC105281976 isoform X2 [Ooceraea biroi]